MTLEFIPFTEADYERHVPRAIESYGEDLVRAKLWDEATIAQKTEQVFRQLLPEGRATPGNEFWSVSYEGEKVGWIWTARREDERGPYVGIYYLEVIDSQRRRGYGRMILEGLERRCVDEGVKSIRLHVFGHNLAARGLYDCVGFETKNVVMEKHL